MPKFPFSGGMSEVVNPVNLADTVCEKIENMYLDSDGTWKAYLQPVLVYPESSTATFPSDPLFKLENDSGVALDSLGSIVDSWTDQTYSKAFSAADDKSAPIITTLTADKLASYPTLEFKEYLDGASYKGKKLKATTLAANYDLPGLTMVCLAQFETVPHYYDDGNQRATVMQITVDFGIGVGNTTAFEIAYGAYEQPMSAPYTWYPDRFNICAKDANPAGTFIREEYDSVSLRDGKWHLIVATLDLASKTIKLYIDGLLVHTHVESTWSGNPYSGALKPTDVVIGQHYADARDKMQGKIAASYGFKKAISAAEVASLCAYVNNRYATYFSDTSVFANYHKIYQWTPAFLPTGTITDTFIYIVFYKDGTVARVCKTATDVYTKTDLGLTGISYTDVYAWADSNQFVFVDGRGNFPAQRIRINSEGTVYIGNIASASSYLFPILTSLVFSEEDGEGTGIGKGGIYGWRAVFVNEFGDYSKPTPLLMADTYQWQKRGERNGEGTYIYDDKLRGSLKSAIIRISGIPANTVEVQLYRCDAYASESRYAMYPMRRVATKAVSKTTSTADIVDSFPYGASELVIDSSGSPSGDDIALNAGTIFIGNAVNTLDFPVDLVSTGSIVEKITITNPNDFNYVNRWFMIDLFDDTIHKTAGTDYLVDFSWDTSGAGIVKFDTAKFRILADDFITPLEVYAYPVDDPLDGSVSSRRYLYVRIPYVIASGDTIIYVVQSIDDFPNDYPNKTIELDGVTDPQTLYSLMTANPVKSEESLIAISNKTSAHPSWLPSNYKTANKVNSNFETTTPFGNEAFFNIGMYSKELGAEVACNDTTFRYGSVGETLNEYTNSSLFLQPKGYFSLWFKGSNDIVIDPDGHTVVYLVEGNNDPYLKLIFINEDDTTYKVRFHALANALAGDIEVITGSLDFVSKLARLFILCSWEFVPNPTIADSTLKISMTILNLDNGDYFSDDATGAGFNIDGNDTFATRLYAESVMQMSHFMLQFGDYIAKDGYDIYQLNRWLPYFPIGYIGIDYTTTNITISGTPTPFYDNANIVIEKVTTVSENKPGRIWWNSGGISEENLSEDILRIAPSQSFQPTDEHNTILLFTKNDYWALPLFNDGTNGKPVKIGEGLGLVARPCLSVCYGGVVWQSGKGIYYLTKRGYSAISDGFIDTTTRQYYFFADTLNKRIWLINSATRVTADLAYVYVYDIVNKNWHKFLHDSILVAGWFQSGTGHYLIDGNSTLATHKMYELSGTAMTTIIKTKAYNIGRRNKINRIRLLGNLFTGTFTYLVKMIGSLISGGTSNSTTYTATHNKAHSPVNAKSEYAQFQITGSNQVSGIEIEVK